MQIRQSPALQILRKSVSAYGHNDSDYPSDLVITFTGNEDDPQSTKLVEYVYS